MQCEWPEDQWRIDAHDAQRCRWIAGVIVVITADERDGQLAPRSPPPVERVDRVWLHAGARVQQVAEDQQLFRAGIGDRCVEPVQASAGGAMWYRYAQRAKRRRFAPVEVGHDQCA